MNKKRVVITGLGIVAPNGNGIPQFMESLKLGKNAIKKIKELEELNFSCQIGAKPDDFDEETERFLENYQYSDAGYNVKYSVVAAKEAWLDAGFCVPEYNSSEVDYETGVIIGSGVGSADLFKHKIIPFIEAGNVRKLRSHIAEFTMFSAPSANVAGLLALGNKISSNSSACSTGNESIIEGYERIKEGKAKRMLVGSSEIPSPYVWGCFDSMRLLSRKFNENPEFGSRPMSATASGFVPSAGGGVLVLEELETALSRNAKIYGEILGSHINCGGQRNGGTMQAPGQIGVQRCLKSAIEDANISPNDIDYISGHLSSTMADPLEIDNWCKALNRHGDDFPYINSLKSMIGHCLGAAGTIETISAILQMNGGFLHPSLNSQDIHPEILPMISASKIPQKPLFNVNINIFAKASFGFGDINSCIIIGKLNK
jgi:3-oxoacyl-(acyl-carrier-protein) synthase